MSRLPELGTVKRIGAILVALVVVLAAGTVVGQAPALFGADVTEEPEGSIEFSDQTGDGTSATVDNVTLSDGGFVVVTSEGEIVGVSEYLGEGDHENVTVEQRGEGELLGQLTATAHQDVTGNETFVGPEEAGEDEDHDRPYIGADGYPVSDTATVSMPDGPEEGATSTSFIVESANATDRVPVNDTLEITSEIRNPNDFEDQQPVDFRIDGEVRERQIVSLSADETRQLNFTIDLSGVEPGEHGYGIYTDEDGAVDDFLVEYAPADVTVVEATPEEVVADATLPIDGFLAVEDGNGSVVATSDALEYGDHENVTIDVGDELADGETATVVVYGGDPGEVATTVPYVDGEGDPVQATATVEGEADDALSPGGGIGDNESNGTDDGNQTNETNGTDATNESDGADGSNESDDGSGNETQAEGEDDA
ncbi:DUF7282 domain-containing protein [Saliphagus infecundisoli]|uniref:DUF4179 domain-containing protein n=1 Tax=Saliphagus infecundisoli TaxID=1849069 RepID=A0ABD5QGT8_9EURY|nr:DUF4179 domain-containing protein [Saliphagus infecundisoli]